MGNCASRELTNNTSCPAAIPPTDPHTPPPLMTDTPSFYSRFSSPSRQRSKSSSFRSSLSQTDPSFFNEAYGIVYEELHFNEIEIGTLKDIYLQIIIFYRAFSSSPSSDPLNISFESFFHHFNLQQTPFSDRLLHLWLSEEVTTFNFLFFLCSVWHALTLTQEDVVTYVFSCYANSKTKLFELNSIERAMRHIHLPSSAAVASCLLEPSLDQGPGQTQRPDERHGHSHGQGQGGQYKQIQKILHCLRQEREEEVESRNRSTKTSLPMSYQEWCDCCSDHPLLLEPIYTLQACLRERLGGEEMWLTMMRRRELSSTQTSSHYLSHLHSLYDEALLKHTLTSRLNALSQLGDSYSSRLSSAAPRRILSTSSAAHLDTDSEDDCPAPLLLRKKPTSRSSSTSSLQSMILVSDCDSSPGGLSATVGIVLRDKRYDTDGDTISVASSAGGGGRRSTGGGSDYGQYEEEGVGARDESRDQCLPGGWYRGQSNGGDGEEEELLSPRSVLSDSGGSADEDDEKEDCERMGLRGNGQRGGGGGLWQRQMS
jgi:hypothetical protein